MFLKTNDLMDVAIISPHNCANHSCGMCKKPPDFLLYVYACIHIYVYVYLHSKQNLKAVISEFSAFRGGFPVTVSHMSCPSQGPACGGGRPLEAGSELCGPVPVKLSSLIQGGHRPTLAL